MDDVTLGHIFEPFFTTKGEGKGTGLGLATVYGIVKQNGGYIEIASTLGGGTTIEVSIPRSLETPAGNAAAADDSTTRGSGQRILLVEDEKSLLATTKVMLERLGYTVSAAAAPEEALRIAASEDKRINLVLTDMVMPGMNGLQLSERLKERRQGLPVLFMSGYTAEVLTDRGMAEGEINLLKKPFTLTELSRAIHGILG